MKTIIKVCLYFFFKSVCCSRIEVILDGDVQVTQGSRSGIYQRDRGLINNRNFWNQIDGGNSLWYSIRNNRWFIGSSSSLGTNTGGIFSVQAFACPTSDNFYQYVSGGEFIPAPINSVFIQCV